MDSFSISNAYLIREVGNPTCSCISLDMQHSYTKKPQDAKLDLIHYYRIDPKPKVSIQGISVYDYPELLLRTPKKKDWPQ